MVWGALLTVPYCEKHESGDKEEDDEEGFFETDDEVCGGFGEASIAKETLVLMKQVWFLIKTC